MGHYQADGPVRMLRAVRERWRADRDGPAIYPGSRAWRFLQQDGALTPLPLEGAAAAPDLRAGQAVVYAQVSYQPAQHDVASLVSISRPAAASP